MDDAGALRLVQHLRGPADGSPVRYATVIASPGGGVVTVRPSSAEATDGSQDVTTGYLGAAPAVGAKVRIEATARGDVLVLGQQGDTNRPLFGTVAVTVAAGTGSATVTYPAGRFTVQPRVVCGCEGGTPFTAQPLSYNGTTGFDVLLTQVGASSYSGTRTVTYTASVAG